MGTGSVWWAEERDRCSAGAVLRASDPRQRVAGVLRNVLAFDGVVDAPSDLLLEHRLIPGIEVIGVGGLGSARGERDVGRPRRRVFDAETELGQRQRMVRWAGAV